MATVYRSKADTWLVIVLTVAMIIALGAAIAALLADPRGSWWIVVLIVGLGIILPLWVLLSIRYTLDSKLLLVQSGPFKWKIPVAEITNITPTSNPLSSPALSLDRLRIDYGKGRSIMISPENKEAFLIEIEDLRRAAS